MSVSMRSNLIYVYCIKNELCSNTAVYVNDNFVAVSVSPLSDAQTLSHMAVSLRRFFLRVSHTDYTALSTVFSLPGVTELWVTVCSDVKASA